MKFPKIYQCPHRKNSENLLFRVASLALLIYSILTLWSWPAFSYKLSPTGTKIEKSAAKKYSNLWQRIMISVTGKGVTNFTEPVHEEITNLIYGCNGDSRLCGDPDSDFAGPYVLAGVRWNDDPPFRLVEGEASNTSCKVVETIRFTTQPQCWAELFRDAKKKAIAGESLDAESRASLLARSHFGDLQFLHAMASKDGELAVETQKRIMMWAEFTWKVGHGDYSLGTRLQDVKIEGLDHFFGRSDWTVQDLFSLGNPVLRPHIKDVAFGSMLHLVEDSFPKGHVDRGEATFGEMCPGTSGLLLPGRIREFHSYVNQDSTKHAEYDSRKALAEHLVIDRPTVVEIGRVLLGYYQSGSTWEQVQGYTSCVFTLANPEAKSSAGLGFKSSE